MGEPAKPSTPLMRNIARRLAERFPPLATVPVLRSWAGVVEQTPDYSPILDWLESPAGFVIATASGHGFGLCPAIGKVVSERLTKGTSSIPVTTTGQVSMKGNGSGPRLWNCLLDRHPRDMEAYGRPAAPVVAPGSGMASDRNPTGSAVESVREVQVG